MLKGKIKILDVASQSHWKTPEILIWRPPAIKIRPYFNKVVFETQKMVLDLDFSGIETMDGSFIDELLITEIRKMENNENPVKFIYVSNLVEGPLYNMELVFTKSRDKGDKKFILVALGNGAWKLFCESIEKSLYDTLKLIMERKQITSNYVAKYFNITVPAASVRLKTLYDLRLVYREEELSDAGKEYNYLALF